MGRLSTAVALLGLALSSLAEVHTTHALMSFGPPEIVAADGSLGDVATDGAGTWIVAAETRISFGCCDNDIAYRRSTDGGVTWGLALELNDEGVLGTGPDYSVRIAADGADNWIAIWSFVAYDDLDGESEIFVARSDDDGVSWSAAAPLAPGIPGIEVAYGLDTDGAGTWIASWRLDGTPDKVYVSRSTDDGASWTTTQVGTGEGALPRIATNQLGRWAVVWSDTGPGGDYDVVSVRSVDGGLSWSPQAFLNTNAATDADHDFGPDVAADASGTWIAAWASADAIVAARSADAATWAAPVRIDVPTPKSSEANGASIVAGGGEWAVTWSSRAFRTLGDDWDALFVRSRDGGVTWSLPAAINLNARWDKHPSPYISLSDFPFGLATDGMGTWVVGYSQNGGGLYLSTTRVVVSLPDCPATPAATCKQTIAPRGSQLVVQEQATANDLLTWKWRGEDTTPAELGDPPLGGPGYVLCLYDETSGTPALVYETDAPAGGTCQDSDPCWAPSSQGFKYRDRRNARSAITRLDVAAGADGRARASLKVQGFSVAPPFMPLDNDARVRAQLHNLATGACWEGAYTAPTRNTTILYRAVSD